MILSLMQVDIVPPVDPGETVNTLISAAQGSHWALLVGCVLCLTVWVIRTFVWKSASPKFLPWLAVAIGATGCAGFALISDPGAWLNALVLGVNGGLSAAGTWGLLKVARKS